MAFNHRAGVEMFEETCNFITITSSVGSELVLKLVLQQIITWAEG